ncbi:MAG: DNA polymerase ligase N-terminal domain-containing protein [Promethearchaeia archaeon]
MEDINLTLKKYKEKRDFKRTKEPKAKTPEKYDDIFVIQKHRASSLHYDFRIAVNGVLKSWAVPKGPSTDPSEKRLAIMTEDHPLAYADFEGIIPEGEYGAGTVIVWDKGQYENMKQNKNLQDRIKKGHFTIFLDGKKLKGGFALTRINNEKNHWLLVKMSDKFVNRDEDILEKEPRSVFSGKTIEEIKAQDN